jgi:cobalamin biosynthesis protein CobD/CbiB
MEQRSTVLLRIAIAFAFLYPPFDSYFHPLSWISFFPPFMQGHVSDGMLLFGWGVLEVIIAVWILSGKKIFIPSLAATILLLAIVAFNLTMFEIVFRDVSLALVAATLAWWSYPVR